MQRMNPDWQYFKKLEGKWKSGDEKVVLEFAAACISVMTDDGGKNDGYYGVNTGKMIGMNIINYKHFAAEIHFTLGKNEIFDHEGRKLFTVTEGWYENNTVFLNIIMEDDGSDHDVMFYREDEWKRRVLGDCVSAGAPGFSMEEYVKSGMPVTVEEGRKIQEMAKADPQANGWICPKCRAANSRKFCTECGSARPTGKWTCLNCNAENEGKFCSECGAERP